MEKSNFNVYIPEGEISRGLSKIFPQTANLFGSSNLKIFYGREWFIMFDDEIVPELPEGEKFNHIFLTAENLCKYFYHSYKMNLKVFLEKHGTETTKVTIFSCCDDCDSFVRNTYKDVKMEFIESEGHYYAEDISKMYFAEYLKIE